MKLRFVTTSLYTAAFLSLPPLLVGCAIRESPKQAMLVSLEKLMRLPSLEKAEDIEAILGVKLNRHLKYGRARYLYEGQSDGFYEIQVFSSSRSSNFDSVLIFLNIANVCMTHGDAVELTGRALYTRRGLYRPVQMGPLHAHSRSVSFERAGDAAEYKAWLSKTYFDPQVSISLNFEKDQVDDRTACAKSVDVRRYIQPDTTR